MKKKKNLIICALIILIVIVIGIILLIVNNKEEKDTYSKVSLGSYKFSINDKYGYEYIKEDETGILNNEMFLSSYIFISDKDYSSLISESSYFTNMGAEELDSSIEEMTFGEYEGFVNVKKVNYEDIEKDYNLVIILIKISVNKTFVFQYEISVEEETEKVLEDIKNGLVEIEKE